jgi:putative SOS response-associated peptidase YedK
LAPNPVLVTLETLPRGHPKSWAGYEELTARYNVAPTGQVPIVVANNGGRRLVRATWGFRAAWMTNGKLAPSLRMLGLWRQRQNL